MWAEKRTQAWLFRLTCALFLLCLGRKLEVQWDENGNLTLVGRCTDMVKIHGNRVEPAEIESVFKRLTGADWAAVRAFAEEEAADCSAYTIPTRFPWTRTRCGIAWRPTCPII